MTQHENKFAKRDQALQEQSHKHVQLQKRIERLQLGNTVQGSRITYVYYKMKELKVRVLNFRTSLTTIYKVAQPENDSEHQEEHICTYTQ